MMAKKSFPLSRVYQLLEPGPVVLFAFTTVLQELIHETREDFLVQVGKIALCVANTFLSIGAWFAHLFSCSVPQATHVKTVANRVLIPVSSG